MKIKICGITRPEEIEYLREIGADFAGFVFFEKSKRNLSYEKAAELLSLVPDGMKKVAVVVSPDAEQVERLQNMGFDLLQIHKELTESVVNAASIPIWYAVNISDETQLLDKLTIIEKLGDNSKKIKGIVVDGANFGSGQVFNWHKSKRLLKAGTQSPPEAKEEDSILSKILADREFVLAGGLNSENVREGISLFSPDVVDVSSGVEGECGKDHDKILAFAKAVRTETE